MWPCQNLATRPFPVLKDRPRSGGLGWPCGPAALSASASARYLMVASPPLPGSRGAGGGHRLGVSPDQGCCWGRAGVFLVLGDNKRDA